MIESGGVAEVAMLCSLSVGGQSFGIDTRALREVLDKRIVQRVPLAPRYIAGIVSYRGEVLTTVSLRALLGLGAGGCESCVLVLDGAADWNGDVEPFGLLVDEVGAVVAAGEDLLRINPPLLPEAYRAICCAAFEVGGGLIVQLDPEQLTPARLTAIDAVEAAQRMWMKQEGQEL